MLLVENTRVDGKVKQEIIAMLGTIDATWLESFWERLPDASWRHKRWEYFSLTARVAFWDGVLERMGGIGDNRLSKDDRVAVRRAIHKVVPWVMEPERKRIAVLEAQHVYWECNFWHDVAETRRGRSKDDRARYQIAQGKSGRVCQVGSSGVAGRIGYRQT